MRDFQRQKVYNAEREWRKEIGEYPKLELLEIEVLATKMLRSRGINCPVKIRPGKGNRRATANFRWGWAELTFPIWSRTLPIVVHETAHIVAWKAAGGGHGPTFCRASLCLVRDYIGLTQASLLQTYYTKHRLIVSEAQEAHRNRKSHIEARLKISL